MSILIKELSYNQFEVTVTSISTTTHTVTLSNETYNKLTNKKITKEKLLEHSFNFLLDREPNTSILSSFELTIISNYFPEYEVYIKKAIN